MELIRFDNETIVTREWQKFIERGNMPKNIPNEIAESWKRCKEFKIDPYGGKSTIILTPQKLREKLDKNERIINLTKPYLKQMYNNIELKGYIIFLTDDEGNIIYVDGDKSVMDSFSQSLNFFIGASWSEEAVGTTAVSLAISIGKSIPFVSQEKYCCKLKQKACTAVPIMDCEEQIIAILGVAADFSNPNPYIYNILLSAKMAIEYFLRNEMLNEKLKLIDGCYRKVFQSVSDPIIMLDNNGIIIDLNSKAKEIIVKNNKDVDRTNIMDLIGFNPMISGIPKVNIDNNIYLKKLIPVYDNSNNIKLNIGFLDFTKVKGKKSFYYRNRSYDTRFCFSDIIGSSNVMQKVKKTCMVAAKSDFNVLIQGKSGTGKELFAQAIHGESNRKYEPFVAVNCGAIPSNLIESEFFGYEKGAFTGALKEGKPGKFELADGGTLFLDEIGDMPISLQTSLLRVLQEHEITRVGGYNPKYINVRVIAATNKNLLEEVNKGNFRQDLFWRLNVIPIHIPSLKERKDDILELIEYFINKYSKNKRLEFHTDVMKIFKGYDWTGNVRELENLVKRLLVFVDGNLVTYEDLPDYMINKAENIEYAFDLSLAQIEKAVIEKMLKENNNNVSETARKLRISRNTIYNKLGV